jgi:hypothetical protein
MDMESFLEMQQEWDEGYLSQCFAKYIEEGKSMSQETRDELFIRYYQLSNNDINTRGLKRIGLLSLGLPENEVDEMCEEKEIDKDAMLRAVSDQAVKERRKLRRQQRKETSNS